MRTVRIASAGAVVALVAATAAAALPHRPAASRRSPSAEPVFYDISGDPSALKLLALSASGHRVAYTLIDEINVMRDPKLMQTNTWRINCAGERMSIIHAVSVQPGSPVQEADVDTAPISTRASPAAFELDKLACAGEGQLVERRTYRGELIDIVKRFWAQ